MGAGKHGGYNSLLLLKYISFEDPHCQPEHHGQLDNRNSRRLQARGIHIIGLLRRQLPLDVTELCQHGGAPCPQLAHSLQPQNPARQFVKLLERR